MHVLGHVYQQFLDWARSLWQSGRGPALQLSQDSLEGVFGEAIASPTEALQLLVQQLVSNTTTGIQFASVALLSSDEGDTFGVTALHGRGSEHFPAVLRSNETAWPDGKRRAQLQRFTLSPKQVFLTSDSNWAVADVHSANMEMPCFYECLSSARGLPREAQWLGREGMRSMLTLPCIHEGSVWGVLTVASPQSRFKYEQVVSLQHLCYQVTPLVVKARNALDSVLCNGQFSRFQSTSELATCMLDELVQLDKILVRRINQCAAESALEEEKAAALKAPPSTPKSCSFSQIVLPTPPLSAPPLARHTPKCLATGPLSRPSLDADGPSYAPIHRVDMEDSDGGYSTSRGGRARTRSHAADPLDGSMHGTLSRSQAPSYNDGMVHADISALLGEAMDAGTLSALTDTTTNSSAGTPRNSGQYSRPGTNAPPHHPKRRGGSSNYPPSRTSIPGSSSNCPPSRTSMQGSSSNCPPSRTSIPGSSSHSPRTSCLGRAAAAQDCSSVLPAAHQYSSQPQQPQGIHPSRQLPEKPCSAPALTLRGGCRSTGRHSQSGAPDVSNVGNNMGRRGTVQPGVMIQTQEAGWGEVQDEVGGGGQCHPHQGCRVSTTQQGGFSTCGGSDPGYESGSGEEGGGRLEVWELVGHHKPQWGAAEENWEQQGAAQSQQQHHHQQQQHHHQQQQLGQRHGGSVPYSRHAQSNNRRGERDEEDVGLWGVSEEEEEKESDRRGSIGLGNSVLSRESSASAPLSDRSPSSGDDPKLWGLDVFMKDSSMLDDFSRRLQGSAAYVAAVAQAQEDQSAMVMAASDRASTNRSVGGRKSIGGGKPSPPSRGLSMCGSADGGSQRSGGSRPNSGPHATDSGSGQAHLGKTSGRFSQPLLAPASNMHDLQVLPPASQHSNGREGRQNGTGSAEGSVRTGACADGVLERGSRGRGHALQDVMADGQWGNAGQEGVSGLSKSPDKGWWEEEGMADGEQELRRPHVWCSSAGALEYEAGFEDDEDVVAARAAQEPAQFLVSNLLHAAEAERVKQQQQQQRLQQQQRQQEQQQVHQQQRQQEQQQVHQQQKQVLRVNEGWTAAEQLIRQQERQRQELQSREARASFEEYHNRQQQQRQLHTYDAAQASPFQTEATHKPSNAHAQHHPPLNLHLQPQLQAVQPSPAQLLQQQQQQQKEQQQLSELSTWHQQLPMLLPSSSRDSVGGCCTRSPLDPATLLPPPHPPAHARYPNFSHSAPPCHQLSSSIPSPQLSDRSAAWTDWQPPHHRASSLGSRRLFSMPITIQPPDDIHGTCPQSDDLSCNLSAHCGSLDNTEVVDPATASSTANAVIRAGLQAAGSNGSMPPSSQHPLMSPLESLAGQPAAPLISSKFRRASLDAASGGEQRQRQSRDGDCVSDEACAGGSPAEGMLRQHLGAQPLSIGKGNAQEVHSPHRQLHQLHSLQGESCVLSPPQARRLFSLPEEQEGMVAS